MKSLTPATLLLVSFAPLSNASTGSESIVAKNLSVKTSIKEVNGVREIENGNFAKGIRKSEAALNRASTSTLRKPLLDNLCAANLAIGDLSSAEKYCNEAVKTGPESAISYNNRAVFFYAKGDLKSSFEDLELAEKLGSIRVTVSNNLRLISESNLLSKN